MTAIKYVAGKNVCPFCRQSLCLNDRVLCCAETPQLHEVTCLDLNTCANGVLYKNSSPVAMSSKMFFILSSIRFNVSGFASMSFFFLIKILFFVLALPEKKVTLEEKIRALEMRCP